MDPIALVQRLAPALGSAKTMTGIEPIWNEFVHGFPAALRAEAADWRHLLLAARVVVPRLGLAPLPEVADSLHAHVRRLAAEESS
jgi:hypothetical protein